MRRKEYRKADIYKDKLVYFFSSSSPRNAKLLFEMGIQQQLISYHYILKAEKIYETEVLPLFDFDGQGLFMTDSGGATYVEAFRNKTYEESWFHADHWKPYLQAYTEWLYEHRKMIFVAANIDLEMYVGNSIVDKWNRKYFKPLEKDMNIAYVVHESQFDKYGIKRFTQYCQEHSYVGVNSDLIALHAKFYSIAKQYRRRVHGFAVSSIPTLTASPMFSCDSSVVGDSFVTVRSNGLIEHLRIDELFNRLTSYRTTPTELRAPLRNCETLTLDDSNKVVWSKLRSVVQHVVSKPMVKLELEGGETLEVTADHSMILMDSYGKTYEESATVLQIGDYVIKHRDSTIGDKEIILTKVTDIKYYESKDLDVYDLEVPNTEKFIANGVIVHNTTWLGGARYGTTYRFNGANLKTIDYHNKHVRKRDKILCEDYNIDFDKFLGDAETEINKHAIVNWDAAMGKIRKIGDTKLWNEPVVNYDFNRKSKLIVPKIIVPKIIV